LGYNRRRGGDPRLPGLVHDLNNVFQALLDVAELLSADARSEFLAARSCAAWSGGKTSRRACNR